MRESPHARTIVQLCAAVCHLVRPHNSRAHAPPRHLDSSSTASAQTRSPHCATNSTTLSAALHARRTQRQDRGRSPCATPCLRRRTGHWVLPSRPKSCHAVIESFDREFLTATSFA